MVGETVRQYLTEQNIFEIHWSIMKIAEQVEKWLNESLSPLLEHGPRKNVDLQHLLQNAQRGLFHEFQERGTAARWPRSGHSLISVIMLLKLNVHFKTNPRQSLTVASRAGCIHFHESKMFYGKNWKRSCIKCFSPTTDLGSVSSIFVLCTDHLTGIGQLFWIPGKSFLLWWMNLPHQ